jgi:hypothetical protein
MYILYGTASWQEGSSCSEDVSLPDLTKIMRHGNPLSLFITFLSGIKKTL